MDGNSDDELSSDDASEEADGKYNQDDDEKDEICFECLMCLTKYDNARLLGQHYKLVHGRRANGNMRFQCPKCPKNYAGKGDLKAHWLSSHLDFYRFDCPVCKKGFQRRDNMERHIKSTHNKSENKRDPLSSEEDNQEEETTDPPYLKNKCSHNEPSLRLDDTKSSNMCSVCGKYCVSCGYFFISDKFFAGHTHVNFCVKCRVKFRNGKYYALHKIYHKRGIKEKCEECLLGFTTGKKLHNHKRIWHGLDPLSCMECGKAFHSKRNLNLHRIIHKEKRFKCDTCPMAFHTNAKLKRHVGMHERKSKPKPAEDEPNKDVVVVTPESDKEIVETETRRVITIKKTWMLTCQSETRVVQLLKKSRLVKK